MACKDGNCSAACCHWPFPMPRWGRQLGQFPTLPSSPADFGAPCTTSSGEQGWQFPGQPCIPVAGGAGAPMGPCYTEDGAIGWRAQQGGACVGATIPGQQPQPAPGFPGFPQPCQLPDGGQGWTDPQGNCQPWLQQLPGGAPVPPGVPDPGAVPGLVTEQECASRAASAAQAAKTAEENKVVKYAAITGVVSGVIGIALGKIF